MHDDAPGRLFTIGYEATRLDRFIGGLLSAGVSVVADVRAIPQSRKPGFSKTGLAASLAEAGIAYHHLRPLGTPKAGRIAARHGDGETLRRIYQDHLAGDAPTAALAELAQLAHDKPTCLLCFERDHRMCHRSIVGERLSAEGALDVVHLLPPLPDER